MLQAAQFQRTLELSQPAQKNKILFQLVVGDDQETTPSQFTPTSYLLINQIITVHPCSWQRVTALVNQI